MQKTISCDWLQCRVQIKNKNYSIDPQSFLPENSVLYAEVQPIQTQMFHTVIHFKLRKLNKTGHWVNLPQEVAVLACNPRNELTLAVDQGILKVINKFLYQSELKVWFQLLLNEIQLRFMNYVRIDVACDMLQFDSIKCEDFIVGFMNDDILKVTKVCNEQIYRESTGVKRGKLNRKIKGMKWGRESNDVSYRLYNKTLEMAEVKEKAYIKDHWRSWGWDGYSDVWRLEFALLNDSKVKVLEDGRVLNFRDIDLIDMLPELFKFCYTKYFQFVYKSLTKNGNVRKQSRSMKIDLFTDMDLKGVIVRLTDKEESGKSDKILLKKLHKENQALRGESFEMALFGSQYFTYLASKKGLISWAEKKIPDVYFDEPTLGKMFTHPLRDKSAMPGIPLPKSA